MNLDVLAAILCGWMALCLFALHVVSSPRRHPWMTLPEYVRRGLVVTGAMFTWRSVNFATLAPAPFLGPGHINVEGMLALIAITYLATSLAWWAAVKVLPGKGWARVDWVIRKESEDPDLVPVVVPRSTVEQMAKDQGMHVNAEPPVPPKERLH